MHSRRYSSPQSLFDRGLHFRRKAAGFGVAANFDSGFNQFADHLRDELRRDRRVHQQFFRRIAD